MKHLVWKGKFITKDSQVFLDKVQKIMNDTQTLFDGEVLIFDVLEFDEYELIEDGGNNNATIEN